MPQNVNIFHFFQKYVGRFGIFNLVLLALENVVDDYFICPCKHDYNVWICFLFGAVPALGCLIFTLLFLDLSPRNENGGEVQRSRCDYRKVFYSVLSVSVWLSFYFLDGRYLACAYSDWEAVYTKSESFGIEQWCKPTGNETSELESQQKTLELMSISQFIGYGLMTVVIVILAVYKYRCQETPEPNTAAPEQGQRPEGIPLMPLNP